MSITKEQALNLTLVYIPTFKMYDTTRICMDKQEDGDWKHKLMYSNGSDDVYTRDFSTLKDFVLGNVILVMSSDIKDDDVVVGKGTVGETTTRLETIDPSLIINGKDLDTPTGECIHVYAVIRKGLYLRDLSALKELGAIKK